MIIIKSITQIIGIFITDIDAFCVNSSTRLSRLYQIMTSQPSAGLKIFATFLLTSLIRSSKNMHCIGFLWTFSGRKSDLCLLEDKFVWITPIEFQWLLVGSRYETEEISFPFSFSVCQIFCVKKENMFSFCVRKISVERRSSERRRSQSTLLAAMMQWGRLLFPSYKPASNVLLMEEILLLLFFKAEVQHLFMKCIAPNGAPHQDKFSDFRHSLKKNYIFRANLKNPKIGA